MKTLVAILGASLFSLSVYSQAATAADQPAKTQETYYHLCHDSDLVGGTWKLMKLQETPKRKEASLYASIPYQYISFYTNNYYAFVNTNREIKKALVLQKAMQWPEVQKHTLRYTLDNQGVLNLYLDKKVTYSYRCVAVSENKGEYKKGDLIVTGYTKKARTKLYKLYRRWF